MRIILKNSFFSVVCFLTVLFFGVLSCQRENGPVEQESGSPVTLESGEAALSFCVSTPVVGVDTKSVITDTYFETGIRSILILVLGEDGSWKSTYKEVSSGYLSTGTGVAALDLDAVKVRACYQDYTVYAFVNMGNVMDNMPVDASGKPTPDAYVYSLPVAYPDLGTRGMPMCAKVTVDTDDLPAGGQANVVLTLRRLMAKVVISVKKTGMTGENAGVLNSSIIRVRQVPRVIRPFAAGGSGALEVVELYGGVGASSTDTDYYSFSAGAAAGAAYHTNVTTLYVPENYQGVGSETSQEKKATAPGETPTGRQALATFLEYKASKSGTNDGISGNLTYKAYLGENVVNDYNVIGDKVYRATLNLSWNGLFFDGDWRVDNSDITDSRRLYLSTTANASSASFDWGRLRRNVASQLYVNFSRDGGASWVHSAKDIDGWPYGWDLYIDGVKQAAGASATAAGDLGWSYIGDPSRDQLFITPGPSSVASSVHTLQVKSADGRVASNEVTFEVSQPLNLYWPYGTNTYYVAQRPVLIQNTGLEDSSATLTFTEKDGKTGIEFVSLSEKSRYIKLLAAGEYTIVVTASNGQTGETTLTVKNPVVEQLWTTGGLWVDGKDSDKLLRYKTTDGTEMTVASTDEMGNGGSKFAPSLYETLLKPRITGVSAVSSYVFLDAYKNLINLNNNMLYVKTLECTIPGEVIKVKERIGQHFNVNVQAGVEALTYETYFNDPFVDVDRTNFNATFHDFTTAYAHMTSAQVSAYDVSKTHTFSSNSQGKIYAREDLIQVETSEDIGDTSDALNATYSGGNTITFSMNNDGFHPSGDKSVYVHVQNRYDVSAGGARAKYSVSKYIGHAKIYMHVVWATIMKPQSFSSQYMTDVINKNELRKENPDDVWDCRYLYGGFVNNESAILTPNINKLTAPGWDSNSFATTALSDKQGFTMHTDVTGTYYVLDSPYGFHMYSFPKPSSAVYSLGYAIFRTFSALSAGTGYWANWKLSETATPFCRYNPSCSYITGTWSGNGLTGYYITPDGCEQDDNWNGYLILHFLQDMPVNPNKGYIE